MVRSVFSFVPLYEFEGRKPKIGDHSYVFENATIIGDVTIGEYVWIGPGAVLRGDYGSISVGDYSAIEDNCVIHARPGEKTTIEEHVTIGHLSVIHTGTIRKWATVGMGSTVSDFSEVGEWAVIAEGAVVKSKTKIPDEAIGAGVPATVIGKVNEEFKKVWDGYKANYNSFATRYREIKKID